jgi:hypothetical protein
MVKLRRNDQHNRKRIRPFVGAGFSTVLGVGLNRFLRGMAPTTTDDLFNDSDGCEKVIDSQSQNTSPSHLAAVKANPVIGSDSKGIVHCYKDPEGKVLGRVTSDGAVVNRTAEFYGSKCDCPPSK